MVREVQRYITLLFENNILNSNHVQSDNEDDACALKSIFLYAFAHVHHSKSSSLEPFTLWRNSHDHWLGR